MEILVAVTEKTHLQRLHHLARLRFIQQESRHGHNNQTLIVKALRKSELGKNSRREKKRDELIDDINGCSRRRYEQKGQNDGHRNRPSASQKQCSRQNKSAELDSQQIGRRCVVDDSFSEPPKNRRPMADQFTKLVTALIRQKISHVVRVASRFLGRLPRQINCLLRNLGFALAGASSHLSYCVPIGIAAGRLHLRIDRIGAEDLFNGAQLCENAIPSGVIER